jgi:ankyrin repeat protein
MKAQNTMVLMLFLWLAVSATAAPGQSHSRVREPVISAKRQKARLALGQLGVEYSNESLVKQAREGDTIAVKLLLDAGLDPNPPLTAAVEAGQLETVQLLLSRGADANRPSGGELPLWLAARARKHSVEVAKLLFEAGADANARGAGGKTPIFALLFQLRHPSAEDRELFKLLLSKRADVNARDQKGNTPLIEAASNGGGAGTVAALLDAGAAVNVTNEAGETALILAARLDDNLDVIRMLLARGAAPNAVAKTGWTALMQAAMSDHAETAKLLLAGGADINLRTPIGTALTLIAPFNRPAMAKLLQEAGAK